jgi:membrane-bound lytic murein transglycosylase F
MMYNRVHPATHAQLFSGAPVWQALLLALCLFCSGCQNDQRETGRTGRAIKPVSIDLPDIVEKGALTALTSYSSTSYFIYKGQVMGYEYELLQQLADYLGLELKVKVVVDMDRIIPMLLKGQGDIIAHGLAVTSQRRQDVVFTDYHTRTHQVLVQRKPHSWRSMKLHEIERALIRDPLDLIGQKVHVRKNTSYYKRLLNLSQEIGGDIDIVPISGDIGTEEIIRMVADGDIDYTIADQHIAVINAASLPILDVETAVSFNQRLAWAVRPNSPKLLQQVNSWLAEIKETPDYYALFNKYFKNKRAFRARAKSEYLSTKNGRISEYDELMKQHAQKINWDWRLLAAMMYVESRFEPKAGSWAGATGLMQIMPATAQQLGFSPRQLKDPETSIQAGIAYLADLQNRWKTIPDPVERKKFILGSYNAGRNHIEDARKLAKKYKADPDVWTDNVEEYIKRKSIPKYYNDPVVQFGYARGSEPYDYVRTIFNLYSMYQSVIPE